MPLNASISMHPCKFEMRQPKTGNVAPLAALAPRTDAHFAGESAELVEFSDHSSAILNRGWTCVRRSLIFLCGVCVLNEQRSAIKFSKTQIEFCWPHLAPTNPHPDSADPH